MASGPIIAWRAVIAVVMAFGAAVGFNIKQDRFVFTTVHIVFIITNRMTIQNMAYLKSTKMNRTESQRQKH
jgi:uncharacterized membrane protein